MVSEKGDIPDRNDVRPQLSSSLIHELVEDNGTEVVVNLVDGSTVELHKHDTHVYDSSGYVYTQSGDDDVWFHRDDVVKVVRHYD